MVALAPRRVQHQNVRIALDAELLKAELDAVGSHSALKRRWRDAPNRTTIYRWLAKGQLPRLEREVLGLANALHLDPLAIIEVDRASFAHLCAEIYRAIRASVAAGTAAVERRKASPFAYVLDFAAAADEWPPREMAAVRISWKTFSFTNPATAQRDYYATIILTPEEAPGRAPCIFHFAWRPNALFPWRPYGFTKVWRDRVELFNYSGAVDEAPLRSGVSPAVETRFGKSAAEFLVASVHRFTAAVYDDAPAGVTAVRFA